VDWRRRRRGVCVCLSGSTKIECRRICDDARAACMCVWLVSGHPKAQTQCKDTCALPHGIMGGACLLIISWEALCVCTNAWHGEGVVFWD
jgi:hypothetical protein